MNVAVTAASQVLQLTSLGQSQQGTLVLSNIGPNTVFIKLGPVGQTVTVSNGYPLLANSKETITFPGEVTHVAVIAAATGNTLYASSGFGQ